jgi:hypothetical protein
MQLLALEGQFTKLNTSFSILQRSDSSLDVRFNLPDYSIKDIAVEGTNYQKIEIRGAGSLVEQGLPDLPQLSTTIAIPVQGSVSLEVLNATQRVLMGVNPYPVQDARLPESSRAFSKNESFYSSNQVYPQHDVVFSEPMILREMRIISISVSPFEFDAATSELRVRESIDIRVNFSPEPGLNELPFAPQTLSAAFAKTYESMILNFADYRDLVVANTPPRYLIIHGNTTDAAFLASLNFYATWKRQKGADVDIATTAANSAGSSTSSIQTYIRNRYNNPATRPDFVILIGDTSGSYAIPAFINNSGGTDYPYTHMNTGDLLGDLFIGRISVENLNQFLVVLDKIYLYERDMDLDSADWMNHMLLVGDNQPSGISTMYISKYIKEMAQEVNPDNTFTEMYGPDFNSFVSGINAAFNQGISFYSFRGYIDFSPPTESALFNGFKLPHAVIITCSTGNYWSGLAETEQLIRYGTTASLKGSVTAIGMSTSSTHTTFNNVLHGGIFEGIYTRGMRTMGEAALHGKLYMNEMFGVSSPLNAEKFAHWCNLMGDPTMEVYVGIPDSFQIQTDASIPLGLSLLDVEVTDSVNQPVEGASVVLSLGFEILSRGYTDSEGHVILVLPAGMTAGDAVITISKHNFKPLLHDLPIVDIATLVPAEMVIDDSASGNNNGIITAGETVDLYFGLRNTGSTSMNRIGGTLYTDSPWVQIVQGLVVYPPIPGGSTAINNAPLVIQVAPNTPHGTMLRLHLALGDGAINTYDVSEFIPVESARAEFISYNVLDGGPGVLDPGDTAQLKVSVKNTGSAAIQNVYAQLSTQNDLIEVLDDIAFIGSLPVNTTVSSIGDHFQVFSRDPTIPGMIMPMTIRLYNAAGFEQFVPFSLSIGTVTQQNPLGPDAYGYVIYDYTDTQYPEAPVYNWVEIAPQMGGLGTALPISDIYNSSDEGDQVGAESLAVVDLPFSFRFYGRYYDQITVCSNGFIALGITGNAEFRNFRLPGAMGPSPMIAAFWDDLATHSGSSISYWFDRANRRFIVEWYNLRNGKDGTSPETFQVMLYDQNYHYTSLGDGPIKIQYHTFNNVDSQSGSRHGNFCTIGIEDHTGTRGLEYTFNNTYPTAAAPLGHGTAIYITNNPSMYDAPITLGNLPAVTLRQGESLVLSDLDAHFQSVAFLNYTVVENPDISSVNTENGLLLSPNPDFHGDSEVGIRASDPMGRHIELYFTLTVHQAVGLYQDFSGGSLPGGWAVGHLGSTTMAWQIQSEDGEIFFAKTSTTQGHTANERLSTNSYNLSGFRNTKVRFRMDFLPFGNAAGTLQYSFNNFTWIAIDSYSTPYTGYKEYLLPVLDNRSSVRLRWTYASGSNGSGADNHWIVDDISITGMYPAEPRNLHIITSGANVLLSWDAVNTDANGNPMTVSGYKVYASDLPEFELSPQTLVGTSATNSITLSGAASAPRKFYKVTTKTD